MSEGQIATLAPGFYWVREPTVDGDGPWTVGELNADGGWSLFGDDMVYWDLTVGERIERGAPATSPANPKEVDAAITALNAAVALDRDAILRLINVRVPCSAKLATHPTIMVAALPDPAARDAMRAAAPEIAAACDQTGYAVGVLGLLNGCLGGGVISARIEMPPAARPNEELEPEDVAALPRPFLVGFERV